MIDDLAGYCHGLRAQVARPWVDSGVAALANDAITAFERSLSASQLLEDDLAAILKAIDCHWPPAEQIGFELMAWLSGAVPLVEAKLRQMATTDRGAERLSALKIIGYPQAPVALAEALVEATLQNATSEMESVLCAEIIYLRKLKQLTPMLLSHGEITASGALHNQAQWLLEQIFDIQPGQSSQVSGVVTTMPEPIVDETWWAWTALVAPFNFLGSNFPRGEEPPVRLRQLLAFQQSVNDRFSGHFKLTPFGRVTARAFFEFIDIADHFAIFGHDADGSLYALWRYDDRGWDAAPVVFLDGHGGFTSVLADTLDGFLQLLGLGVTELGYEIGQGPDWPSKATVSAGTSQFRVWLETELGLTIPENPAAFLAAAQTRHPDLAAWLNNQMLGN